MLIAPKRLWLYRLQIGTRAPRDSPDMTLKHFFERVWPESRDRVNFWALNANNSKMVNITDFIFGRRAIAVSGNKHAKFEVQESHKNAR